MKPNPKLYTALSYSIIICLSITVLVYVIIKASVTSFTHDESFTYLHYVHQPFMDIISYKRPYTNNHILNTVLIKYCEELFGSSEFILRLPNILACLLYMVYAVKLLRKFTPLLIIPCFALLIANTYLIDFFGLARGYGLSFAFLLMSIYHLINYFNSSAKKDLILFNAGAFFAVLSNFSLLNYYASALVVYNILSFYKARVNNSTYHFVRSNKIHFAALVVSIAVLYEPLRRITKQGMLDFGGKEGFLEDTFGSLIRGIFYETPLSMNLYLSLKFFILAVLITTGIIIVRHLYLKKHNHILNHTGLLITYLTLLGIIILSYLQHLLLHNDFYTGRFALFMYPLFILHLLFLLHYFSEGRHKFVPALFLYSTATLLVINVLSNANLQFYIDWKYDSGTKTVVNTIKDLRQQQKDPPKQVSLGINWLFEPTVNFYRYTYDLNWLQKAHRNGINSREDYLYLFDSDTNAYLAHGKPLLFSPDGVNSMLVKNKPLEGH